MAAPIHNKRDCNPLRCSHFSPFILIIPTLLALSLCSAYAEEKEPPKLLVRERTVYVPYEKLKETFEKEGRGVFLPYEEFLKLWNAGQPKEKPPDEVKPPADAVIAGGSYSGVVKESTVRFDVTYKVKALGKVWSELNLPLKNVAVESVSISDPQALFAPKGDGYVLILPRPGDYTLTLAFSVRVDSKPGQRKIEFGIPPTAVSRLELLIPEKDLRVEVVPKMAATVATPEENSTRVLAFVGNADQVAVTWMPPMSKVEKGEAIIIAAQAVHVELGERILRLETTINYKIERNEEDMFRIRMPADMRLLSVKGNNIREWTPENGVLLVRLHSATKDTYALALRFERILEKTPDTLEVPFPATVATLREDGYVTLAHEAGLRLRIENSSGISQIDPRELPDALKRPNLLASFRYLAHPLSLLLKVEAVLPQIQSSVTAVSSLGVDEDGINGFVDYQIAKVGIFTAKLKFENRWEIVTVGDPQTVEDFQTVVDGQYKILTVNLKNKALGTFRLPFKLSGPSRASPGELTLESVQVLDTQQDKGLFGISAPKAFKLTTVEKTKMASANVQLLFSAGLLSQLPGDFEMPLAYSYTQQPASVKISLERRQTEIRAIGFHTVIISEAGMEMTHKLEYFIEFAGVDKLQFSLPSTLDDKLFDVKCPGFKEKKKSGSLNGRSTWEILLQDKVLGAVPLTIIHKENLQGLEPGKPLEIIIPDIRAEDVKSQTGFIAVRKESALEIEPKTSNLEPLEQINLPPELRSNSVSPGGNVYLAFKYFQPDHTLALKLIRHVPIEMTNTVVDLIRATFVVSEEKTLTVQTELWLENAKGEQFLALGLPAKAKIRALAVNGVSVTPLQREGGGTLVKLASNATASASSAPIPVQIIYSLEPESAGKMGWFGSLEVKALEVLGGVPVNKIEAYLYVPEEYAYMGFGGTLHLRPPTDSTSNTLARIISRPVQVKDNAGQFASPRPLLGEFVTQGRLFSFQTLAPLGSISLNYCDRKLFWIFDALVFCGVLAAGWFLLKRTASCSPGGGRGTDARVLLNCTVLVIVPLCLNWLISSDAAEPFAAWVCAGAVLSAAALFSCARNSWNARREAKLATAPDPFLEDAVTETPAKIQATSTTATPDGQAGEKPDAKPDANEGQTS